MTSPGQSLEQEEMQKRSRRDALSSKWEGFDIPESFNQSEGNMWVTDEIAGPIKSAVTTKPGYQTLDFNLP